MVDLENLKTRLKIAKSKMKKSSLDNSEKNGSFMGFAFKLGTELVAAVAVGCFQVCDLVVKRWFL